MHVHMQSDVEAEVTGTIPEWLNGSWVANGGGDWTGGCQVQSVDPECGF